MSDVFGLPSFDDMLPKGEVLSPDVAYKLMRFEFPGPVARAFALGQVPPLNPVTMEANTGDYGASVTPGDLIMGPEGSGKTTTSIFTCALQSLRMPVCGDGVIRARGVVTRDNYRSLQRTTLPSWFNQFPKDLPGAKFEGGQDRPSRYSLRFATAQGITVEMEVDFFGIGDAAIEELLKGYEPSWAYADEADLQPMRVLTFLYGRTGRYPPAYLLRPEDQAKIAAGNDPRPRRVWGTLNPPDEDHWVHQECIQRQNPFFRLYRQPSGLSEKAENRKGVSRSKYEQDAAFRPRHEVRRFVHGEFGYSRDGEIVFPEFDPDRHIARKDVPFDPNFPLMLGIDQGGRPAIALFQQNARRQVVVLDEIVTDPDHVTGLNAFATQVADVLATEYRGARITVAGADPAGFVGADTMNGEMAWAQMLSRALGLQIRPCWTNEVDMRLEAVRALLSQSIDAETPALLVSPRCKRLIRGFLSKYVLKKTLTPRGERLRPFKNEFADIQDALQYGLLTWRGRAGMLLDAAKAGRAGDMNQAPQRPVVLKGNFKVL